MPRFRGQGWVRVLDDFVVTVIMTGQKSARAWSSHPFTSTFFWVSIQKKNVYTICMAKEVLNELNTVATTAHLPPIQGLN